MIDTATMAACLRQVSLCWIGRRHLSRQSRRRHRHPFPPLSSHPPLLVRASYTRPSLSLISPTSTRVTGPT